MTVDGVPVDIAQSALTLPAAAGASNAVDLRGSKLVALITPAGLVSTFLTVRASIDGVTYYPLYDESSNEVVIDVGPEKYITMMIDYFRGVRFLKLATTATEGATRNITVLSVPRV